jgi:hypothetical protein
MRRPDPPLRRLPAVALPLLAALSASSAAAAPRARPADPAAALGLAPGAALPAQPASRRPTRRLAEREAWLAEGHRPELLVPWAWETRGRLGAGRWYDEAGEVWTDREVLALADVIDDPAAERAARRARAARRTGVAFSAVGVGIMAVNPLGVGMLAVGIGWQNVSLARTGELIVAANGALSEAPGVAFAQAPAPGTGATAALSPPHGR